MGPEKGVAYLVGTITGSWDTPRFPGMVDLTVSRVVVLTIIALFSIEYLQHADFYFASSNSKTKALSTFGSYGFNKNLENFFKLLTPRISLPSKGIFTKW